MHTVLYGILVVGGSQLLAVIGLWFVRRVLHNQVTERDHEVAGFMITVLGTMYAVLLAFIVSLLWTQFQDARALVTREANQIGDLSRLSVGFSEPQQTQVRQQLITYTRAVLEDEWPAMAEGRDSQRGWKALQNLWTTFRQMQPQPGRELQLYGASLNRMSELSDSRRLRLLAAEGKVPGLMWVLLWGGAAATIFFTYFFVATNFRSQTLMTAVLAGLIGLILFLILALSNPFAGELRVGSKAFIDELHRIESPATE